MKNLAYLGGDGRWLGSSGQPPGRSGEVVSGAKESRQRELTGMQRCWPSSLPFLWLPRVRVCLPC